MAWNLDRGQTIIGSIFPPSATGENLSQTQVTTLSDNTVDSLAGSTVTDFVEVLQSGLDFASSIYDTGNLDIDPTRVRMTNNSGKPFSFKVSIGGDMISSSTVNSAVFAFRLRSTGNVGTGTLRRYPAGLTTGGLTIDLGFSTAGAFTIADGESVWLECAKSVIGTLIVSNCLILIEPIF